MTTCEGDSISAYNNEATCYRIEGCSGCEKCIVKCDPPCENCPVWSEKTRTPGVGDFVTVVAPIIPLDYKGPKWSPGMDLAIGRTAWVAKGNPTDGYYLKFVSTNKDILDQFIYPPAALRLAMIVDNQIDKLIKTTKEGSKNEEM